MNNMTYYQNIVNKKIFIYQIMCKKDGEQNLIEFPYIQELMTELMQRKDEYFLNINRECRWYGIELINLTNDSYEVIFRNCAYKYRPNLINVNSQRERVSPKNDYEGDKEKTHILIKNNNIAFERKRNGTSISIVRTIFNMVWENIRDGIDNTINKIDIQQILENDIMNMIRLSNKIKKVTFNVKSRYMGTEFYNCQNDRNVEETFNIEIKAKKRKELNKQNIIESLERFFVNSEKIQKVTIDIHDEDDNRRIINSDEFAKQFNIIVEKNNNGEVDSNDMFNKMKDIL